MWSCDHSRSRLSVSTHWAALTHDCFRSCICGGKGYVCTLYLCSGNQLSKTNSERAFFILFQSYLLGKAINYTFYLKNYGVSSQFPYQSIYRYIVDTWSIDISIQRSQSMTALPETHVVCSISILRHTTTIQAFIYMVLALITLKSMFKKNVSS